MARKKNPGPLTAPAAAEQSAEPKRRNARRMTPAANVPPAGEALVKDFQDTKTHVDALRRHTHDAVLQLGALKHQAQILNQELEQTRQQVLRETERLAELRVQAQAVRTGLQEAEEKVGEFALRLAETEARLTDQLRGPAERIELVYAETMGRLQELRREADEAGRQATALRSRSLEAAAEIAQAAAEVRETLQEAAEGAAQYAAVSALLGAESGKSSPGKGDEAGHSTPSSDHAGLGLTVAVDSAKVLAVDGDSPAARAGVAPGDVITSVNDRTVQNGEDLREIVTHLDPRREIVLRLEREGRTEEAHARLSRTAPPTA